MFDFLLLIVVLTDFIVAEGGFLLRIAAVISFKGSNRAVVNLDYLGGNAVKEVAVVGDNKNTSLIGSQLFFQPADGFQI